MRRFFIDPQAITGKIATLAGAEARHLKNVLRLRPDDTVTLFDGSGTQYEAVIRTMTQREIMLAITATSHLPPPATELHLAQGLLKGKKMDMVVQKATELGVAAIHPFVSQHAVAAPPEAEKESRWQRIAIEACKQCNRPQPPRCHPTLDLATLLEQAAAFDQKLFFWEQPDGVSLHQFIAAASPPRTLLFCIGPEGGFSHAEHDMALSAGFTTVSLGRRTLRAETAAIAAAAILHFLLEKQP